MLFSSEPNVKLTLQQLQQLEKMETRTENLVKEIDIHTEKLRILHDDCLKKDKEIVYLDERIKTLTQEVSDLESKKSASLEILTDNNTAIASIQEKYEQIKSDIYTKETELSKRESDLIESERFHSESKFQHIKEIERLEEKKALVEKAHEAFANAGKHITWN